MNTDAPRSTLDAPRSTLDAPRIEAVAAGHICLDVIPNLNTLAPGSFEKVFLPGRLIDAGPASFSTGGSVSNTGLAMNKLGVKTPLMGKLGDDLFGQAIQQIIGAYGNDLADGMIVDQRVSSSYTVVINPPGVDRIFLHCPGANDTFTADDVRYDLLAQTRLFHFGYPPLMKQMFVDDGRQLTDLFRRAKATGVTTSLDMALPDPTSPAGRANWPAIVANTLPYVDIFLPSIEEILYMLRRDAYDALCRQAGGANFLTLVTPRLLEDLSQQLVDLGVKIAGIKIGDRGFFLRTADARGHGAPRARPALRCGSLVRQSAVVAVLPSHRGRHHRLRETRPSPVSCAPCCATWRPKSVECGGRRGRLQRGSRRRAERHPHLGRDAAAHRRRLAQTYAAGRRPTLAIRPGFAALDERIGLTPRSRGASFATLRLGVSLPVARMVASPAMLLDYHTHTDFSYDCSVPMRRQCEAAIAAGVSEIAFTEHEENNPNEDAPNSFRHDAYFQELERCRTRFAGRLTIRAGIEISEPHHYPLQTERVLAAYPWDFVLGSLHWIDEQTNVLRHEFFARYGDWRESFRVYFREMLNLARYGDFDVLAHLDYPARYVRLPPGQAYDIRQFEADIRPALQALIARGKGLEINTGSLRRGLPDPCPPQCVVDWYREMGGAILTAGSDAHRSQDVGAHIPVAIEMARAAGLVHLATFERRDADHPILRML